MLFNINVSSLKFRMTAVVIVLVLLASGLIGFVSLLLAERQMRSVVGEQQYALLSSAAAYLDEDLASKKTLLRVLSEQLRKTTDFSSSALQEFLEEHSSIRGEFFNVAIFNASGEIIANLNDRREIGKLNVGKRKYFRDTLKFKEGVISEPVKSLISGRPVVLVTQPVFDVHGRVLCVLTGGIDLQAPSFFGQLDALKPGLSGYLSAVTADGTIIHHPDKKLLLSSAANMGGGALDSSLSALPGNEGWSEGRSRRGVHALITYKRMRNADWILRSVYPLAEAFTPLIEMRRNALIASTAIAVLSGCIGWIIIIKLLKPLGALRRRVAKISDGTAEIQVFDVEHKDEFGELSRAFYVLSQQRKMAEENLASLARTDSLTGINNRRMFKEVFVAAIDRASRAGKSLALAYLDIDHFKKINDTYGHGVGDQVLVEFASRLKQLVRSTDTVARLAGDEFVVIFENLADNAEPSLLAQKILDTMRSNFLCGPHVLTITTSVGIALQTSGAASVDDYLKIADDALYAAKDAGRNGYVVHQLMTG
jgi:diguanylate cyclase (GGDEF)-like protein